ncbi:hypothetical protein SAMN06296241_1384 [Salinimicrobium sediminis]|uniref:Uncharacterized protein n=1 Tax=Salinimicrobium sediminis TaxID=1343891 RepID=A0A285X4B9_9FLAO|nr:hypothetical protein [Salinimicrobium sediminis]SOC79846.1 hypothetical protein SAMN06296241_1384 [Salinimicrobium sediminis]
MQFSPEEKNKLKAMLLFLVKRKSKESGGHCGFHVNELNPFLDELVEEKKIKSRDTLHSNKFFLS